MTVATLDRVESLSADLAAALGLDASPLPLNRWSCGRRRASSRLTGNGSTSANGSFDLLATLAAAPDRIIRRERLRARLGSEDAGQAPRRRRLVRKVRVKLAEAAPA